MNCAAVPRELYESEFFGHARGAFTGALRDRAGRFELADGGTLFLDEVGEIPLELQAKLLRVLQEGELERVGEERTRKVDVRLIAATNRDLRAEAEAGRFRQDLYYRLSVFPVELPPLRKRAEDIPLLAEHFLALAARKLGRPKPRLTLANVQQLQRYHWPGNVRELQHVIERAVITADGGRLAIELPADPPRRRPRPATSPVRDADDRVLTDAEVRRLEADNIRAALRRTGARCRARGGGRVARDEADHPGVPDQGPGPIAPVGRGRRAAVVRHGARRRTRRNKGARVRVWKEVPRQAFQPDLVRRSEIPMSCGPRCWSWPGRHGWQGPMAIG